MTNIAEIDALAIETRARALRAAFLRDAVRGLIARLRATTGAAARA